MVDVTEGLQRIQHRTLLCRYGVEAVRGVLRGAQWNLPTLADPASLPSDDQLLAQAAGRAPHTP